MSLSAQVTSKNPHFVLTTEQARSPQSRLMAIACLDCCRVRNPHLILQLPISSSESCDFPFQIIAAPFCLLGCSILTPLKRPHPEVRLLFNHLVRCLIVMLRCSKVVACVSV